MAFFSKPAPTGRADLQIWPSEAQSAIAPCKQFINGRRPATVLIEAGPDGNFIKTPRLRGVSSLSTAGRPRPTSRSGLQRHNPLLRRVSSLSTGAATVLIEAGPDGNFIKTPRLRGVSSLSTAGRPRPAPMAILSKPAPTGRADLQIWPSEAQSAIAPCKQFINGRSHGFDRGRPRWQFYQDHQITRRKQFINGRSAKAGPDGHFIKASSNRQGQPALSTTLAPTAALSRIPRIFPPPKNLRFTVIITESAARLLARAPSAAAGANLWRILRVA